VKKLTIQIDFLQKKTYIRHVASGVSDEELQKAQSGLLKLALMTYEDLMTDEKTKDSVRKDVADKVFEMHGLLGKTSGPQLDFHLNIPPEYFGEVFRGLQKITVVAQETVDRRALPASDATDAEVVENEPKPAR
jgi:hypothetical protein